MTDKREAILARLKEIAEDIEDIVFVARNTLEIGEARLPAIAILEGDEAPSDTFTDRTRRPSTSPVPMVMVPELCVIAIGPMDEIGTSLNTFRAAAIKAITGDAELSTLLGRNGSIRYHGMVSDLGLGRAMLGRMALRFAITYIVQPDLL